MSKESKLFSWLGFGKKPATPSETSDQHETPPPTPVDAALESDEEANKAAPESQFVSKPKPEPTPGSEPTAEAELTTEISPATKVSPSESADTVAIEATAQPAATSKPQAISTSGATSKPGLFARLRQGLSKTSQNLGSGLASLFIGKKIDDDLYEELETQLLMADVGVDTTQSLIKQLTQHADRKSLKDAEQLYQKLQQDMAALLHDVEQPLDLEQANGPFVILMVGVNGVGKTTTIGKMAQQFKQQGKQVMLAAGDTFRAAAVEQLQVWGERNSIPVIAQHTGADSASVIFDAYQAAKARKAEILIADTAGRLQNKAHLMEELKKIVRVLQKIQPEAPHEVMLTLDAGTGQNALSQARLFNEAVPLTGITLTKLDGTAKGGVIFAIADQFHIPIRYIGVGESIDDLRAFNSTDFIAALFNKDA
ncbi:signal recognition particle-docking protein FtsY [Alkalimonas collagenimarina]|uniref:Signal recognition particle receptor FtsY n=1 Tax=Alkalimonas collagenimarina TaxID=400390 RepID=A0ABT9GW22_9GAMM|nr:signal recognition particle-docking protein FtsY [Alkalimonas collagenimarina]MDP4535074.1 signal recognition particle-docking protein FtsY [Alkalimonas collagenimarina]